MKYFSISHLKNHQNYKGVMNGIHSIKDSETLRNRIEAIPEDSLLFRSDFPEYHPEFVGETLAELTNEGILVKLSQGIYLNQEGVDLEQCCPRLRKSSGDCPHR